MFNNSEGKFLKKGQVVGGILNEVDEGWGGCVDFECELEEIEEKVYMRFAFV